MTHGRLQIPYPENEPVLSYGPGTPEKEIVKRTLEEMRSEKIEIPLIIGGEEIHTGDTGESIVPHDHGHVLATWHKAGPNEVGAAIEAALDAHEEWSRWTLEERAAVFLKAAELLTGEWRAVINASTMLCQSKTIHQAEIDAACELIDFLKWNAYFAQQLYEIQPESAPGMWNYTDYRPLEGFIYAVSPFNFTSIGGNLTGAPAMMGNTVLWKPSVSAIYSNFFVMRLFEEAGLPPGVINFIPGDPTEITKVVMDHPMMAGIHYTGSTEVFRMLWRQASDRIDQYRSYPRLVGETGGKDFIVAHPTADPDTVRTAITRGAFEYQGQKCSAASRVYLPETIWEEIGEDLVEEVNGIPMGDPADFTNFMGAVINRKAFEKITGYIDRAKASDDAEIIAGGEYDDSEGFYVRPTIIRASKPDFESMCEEIFGPVVTIYVFADDDYEEVLDLIDETSPYGLTGAVFSGDRDVVYETMDHLRYAAGNFYINDKPTGAVVGQQPFGGARASGTNDKAGSILNLIRWVSPRSVKETFAPPTDYTYPFMGES